MYIAKHTIIQEHVWLYTGFQLACQVQTYTRVQILVNGKLHACMHQFENLRSKVSKIWRSGGSGTVKTSHRCYYASRDSPHVYHAVSLTTQPLRLAKPTECK